MSASAKLSRPLASETMADQLRTAAGARPLISRAAQQYDCALCPRRNLRDAIAFWAHMRAAHRPSEIFRHVEEADGGRFEDALVKIVNSLTHDEAVSIATAALLGE